MHSTREIVEEEEDVCVGQSGIVESSDNYGQRVLCDDDQATALRISHLLSRMRRLEQSRLFLFSQ